VDARNSDTGEFTALNERMLVLAYLIPLRDVRIEIALTVELGEVGERTADCGAEPEYVSHCFLIDDGQGAGVCETDRTDVHVRTCLVRVVLRIAEHLDPRLEFGMDFQTNSGNIHSR